MAMSRIVWVLIGAAGFAVIMVLMNLPQAPLELGEANALADRHLAAAAALPREEGAIDVIAPDGAAGRAPAGLLRGAEAVECPDRASATDSVPGGWGGPTMVRETSYACLFAADAVPGRRLYLALRITRSSDPRLEAAGGFAVQPMAADEVGRLMVRVDVPEADITAADRDALRTELRAAGVVFADEAGG